MKVKVKCVIFLEVEIADDADSVFVIEENGCPGTGAVGAELGRMIREGDEAGICWACRTGSYNEVVKEKK